MPEFEIDPVLRGAEAFARTALLEVTDAAAIGTLLTTKPEADGVLTFLFESSLPGYVGWTWAATIAHVPGSELTVVEAELIAGENALLAPPWVPWVERLAEYHSSQLASEDGVPVDGDDELLDDVLAGDDELDDEDDDDDDDEDDDDDDDEDDDDEDGEDEDDDELDDDDGDEFIPSGLDHQLEEIVDSFLDDDDDDAPDDDDDSPDDDDADYDGDEADDSAARG